MLGLRVPKPGPRERTDAAAWPLLAIIRQPSYLIALFGAATGYGVMILAMTATPLAMIHHRHDLSEAALVIQLHVLGMFLPLFVTGSLIAHFGVLCCSCRGSASRGCRSWDRGCAVPWRELGSPDARRFAHGGPRSIEMTTRAIGHRREHDADERRLPGPPFGGRHDLRVGRHDLRVQLGR